MIMKNPKKKILVTGAAGCVGSILAELLARKNYDVIGVDRKGAEFPVIRSRNFKTIEGNLTDSSFAGSLTRGVDVVVNLAASVDISKTYEELAPINLASVKVLYEASKKDGVGFFLHFSTGSIYDHSDEPLKEDSPKNPPNPYAYTKFLSEQYLISQDKNGPRVNIIRPALIIGPKGKVLAGALATVGPLLRVVTSHLLNLTGGAKSNWVHARDVARACMFLIENPQPFGETFNLAMDEPVAVGDMFSTAFRHAGISLHKPDIRWPTQWLKLLFPYIVKDEVFRNLNLTTDKIWSYYASRKGFRKELTPRLDKEAMEFAIKDTIFDNSKFKKLGFDYEYSSFEQAWIDTIEWYKKAKWIP
jgi:nucleoside-diphosphate-sugar epimerase